LHRGNAINDGGCTHNRKETMQPCENPLETGGSKGTSDDRKVRQRWLRVGVCIIAHYLGAVMVTSCEATVGADPRTTVGCTSLHISSVRTHLLKFLAAKPGKKKKRGDRKGNKRKAQREHRAR